MAGAVKQVAIRLKPEGGAEVVAEARKAETALVGAAQKSETATERSIRAHDRQVQKLRELAAEATRTGQRTPVQDHIDRITGVGTSGNARADQAARTLYAADQKSAQLAAAIRAEIDPLTAAQGRYNAALEKANKLKAAGHLSDAEFLTYQGRIQKELDQTTAALGRNERGMTRQQTAGRLNLMRQGADVFTTAAMGMNPGMIAIQQGPQILDAMATSGFKVTTSMIALGGALAVAGGAVVAMGAAWHDAEGDYLALDRVATGLGRTAGLTVEDLKRLAAQGAETAHMSRAAAEDQAAAFVSTGRIGGEVIGGLIGLSKDYAAFMGQDATEATDSLAKAMLDPAAAAKQWTREFGLLDQTTIKHIESLQKHGDLTAAQTILMQELSGAVVGQAGKVDELTSAWAALGRVFSNVWKDLGESLYDTRAERIAKLKQGIERAPDTPTGRGQRERLADRLRREEYLAWAEDNSWRGAGAAENQAAQFRADGADKPRRARSDRSAEREAREAEQRRRREEDRQVEMQIAHARSLEDTDRIRALQDQEALTRRIRQLEDDGVPKAEARTKAEEEQARLLSYRRQETERTIAQRWRDTAREIDDILGNRATHPDDRYADLIQRINGYVQDGAEYYDAWAKAAADLKSIEEARAEVVERNVAAAARGHALTVAELAGNAREAQRLRLAEAVERRAREIEARHRDTMNYGDGASQAAAEIAAEERARMTGMGRSLAHSFVDGVVDGGLEPAMADMFDRLAKRMRDNLVDSLFDLDWSKMLGGLKGGKGGDPLSLALGTVGSLFNPGRNAGGTDYWSGGWSWVGENGPELQWMPRGSQVLDAERSRRVAAGLGGGGPRQTVVNNYYALNGAVMADDLWRRIDRGDRMAAQQGARAGASQAVGFVQDTAAAAQHAERMMKS